MSQIHTFQCGPTFLSWNLWKRFSHGYYPTTRRNEPPRGLTRCPALLQTHTICLHQKIWNYIFCTVQQIHQLGFGKQGNSAKTWKKTTFLHLGPGTFMDPKSRTFRVAEKQNMLGTPLDEISSFPGSFWLNKCCHVGSTDKQTCTRKSEISILTIRFRWKIMKITKNHEIYWNF